MNNPSETREVKKEPMCAYGNSKKEKEKGEKEMSRTHT